MTWTGAGTHTIDTSSTDKRTGTYSGKLKATAAGDSTTNYITLPATSFTAIEAGKKYTLEGWARVATAGTKITAGFGTKWKQSGTISTVAGTFTKYVFNFLATAAEVGQEIRIYCNQADSLYLDDLSLTQAFDCMINIWLNSGTPAGTGYVLSRAAGGANGYAFTVVATGNGKFEFDDYSGLRVTGTQSLINGSVWRLITGTFSRDGNLNLYINGVNITPNVSISGIGRIVNTSTLALGSYTSGSLKAACSLGQVQIVRFADISTATIDPANWYVNGLPLSYAGGSIVFDFNPKRGSNDAEMLQDWSGTGNNLTGTNVTTANRVPATYPIR
jgi:hypothetical protein